MILDEFRLAFQVHGVENSEESPQPDARPETLSAPTSFGPKLETESNSCSHSCEIL